MRDITPLKTQLNSIGQGHLLRFYDSIDRAQQECLIQQIEALDLDALPRLVETYVKHKPALVLTDDLEPAPYFPKDPTSKHHPWDMPKARGAGEELLASGAVGAFVVAGGQGSRLGFEGPKGCFPATPVTGKSLFAVFAEQLLAARRRFGKPVPWYIMTSPLNHDPTVAYFRERSFFGLEERNVMFFPQGVLPSFDMRTGQILMAAPWQIATNPDGHGGSIRALHVSGAVDDMKRRGIKHLSYFQVDNPLVHVLDPVFLGLHVGAGSSAEMSSKMVAKAYPEEKLGVFCRTGGRLEVIEYSDLPPELARQRNADGQLRFNAGSIALHIMSVAFIERLATDPAFELPYHRAEKKIPCINPLTGAHANPSENNGVKLERFVFDALAYSKSSIVYETDRGEEFAPIKNATGVDSVESSRALQTARSARWLEAAGVSIPRQPDGAPNCVLEISPLTAARAEDLTGRPLPQAVEPGARVAL